MPSLSEFISSPIVENIMSIPGISEYNRKRLNKIGIENSHQLLGMFLLIRGDDKFNKWLYNTGVRNRQEIIEAIEEKLNMWIRPSIHDED